MPRCQYNLCAFQMTSTLTTSDCYYFIYFADCRLFAGDLSIETALN